MRLLQFLIQSIRFSVCPSKYSELSDGIYACEVVTPHLYVPASGSSSPVIILKRVVIETGSPTNATFSHGRSVKLTLSSTFLSPTVAEITSTVSISLPASLSGLNATYGKRREETGISAKSSESSSFFLLVACFDFEAFAENRAINSLSSAALSSAFLFCSRICL